MVLHEKLRQIDRNTEKHDILMLLIFFKCYLQISLKFQWIILFVKRWLALSIQRRSQAINRPHLNPKIGWAA